MKPIPHSAETEDRVIGLIAEFPATWPIVSAMATEADFFQYKAAEAFRIAKTLESRGEAVDGLTISALALSNKLEAVAVYVQDVAISAAGQANVRAYIEVLQAKRIERELLKAAMEISDLAYDTESLPERIQAAQSKIMSVGNLSRNDSHTATEVVRQVFASMGNDKPRGLSTGFDSLDRRWGGLRKGALIVLGGRPSMGKTTLALNIAESCPGRVLVFSLEMDREELVEKILSSRAGVRYADVQNGRVLNFEHTRNAVMDAVSKISDSDISIIDAGGQSLDGIMSAARRHAITKPVDLIVIDYLQLIAGSAKQSTYDRISEATRNLKQLAKELNCSVLLLSQLNRRCDERPYGQNRPMMADLRDSGSIEQDADIVAFVYRDVVYNEHTLDSDIAEIITAKCRKGIPGTDLVTADLERSRFVHVDNLVSRQQKASKNAQRTYA
jgi:replicative DNA helicase